MNDLDREESDSGQKETQLPPLTQPLPKAQSNKDAPKRNVRDKGVVSVLSLAASALAIICFVTGRTTLSDFVSPASSVSPAPMASTSVPTQTQTEQVFSQATFFAHYGHLPGRGTTDDDADSTEEDRQKLIAGLENCIASEGRSGKSSIAGQKNLARAQSLRHALAKMEPGSSFKMPALR